jgi:hypothetical protein
MKTYLTKVVFISFFQILSFAAMMQASSLPSNGPIVARGAELTFAENKCQIRDYSGRLNKKILFLAQAENTKYLFRKDGISLLIDQKPAVEKESSSDGIIMQAPKTTQKVELFWDGMNKDADIYGAEEINAKVLRQLNNSNVRDCEIKNYRKLYYTEIYPGVDLRYYDRYSRLRYDLMVHPGFDYSEIKMRVEGADEISINANGQLIIKTATGEIVEEAPMALQDGKPLVAKWIVNENMISIDVKNHNPEKELCIQASLISPGNNEFKL